MRAIKAVIYIASREEVEDRADIKEVARCINSGEHAVSKLPRDKPDCSKALKRALF
jgi:hypothetical protein